MSEWGEYKTPCPKCGGTIEYWFFPSPDDRHEDDSFGAQCRKCRKNFTSKERREIEEKEKSFTSKTRASTGVVSSSLCVGKVEQIALRFAKKIALEKTLQSGRRPTPDELTTEAENLATELACSVEEAHAFLNEAYNYQ